MSTYHEQLLKVCKRAIYLLQRKGWTKEAYARDKRSREVGVDSDAAAKFCSYGAIDRAVLEDKAPRNIGRAIEVRLEKITGRFNISIWNDAPGRTKTEVIAAFKQVQKQIESEMK